MSQENVQIVMGVFLAPDVNIVPLVRDDAMWMELVEAEAPFVHADYESLVMGVPGDAKTYVGPDGNRALWLDWLTPWESYRVGPSSTSISESGCSRCPSLSDGWKAAQRRSSSHTAMSGHSATANSPALCTTPTARKPSKLSAGE
jgi:hypothetical protein